MSCYLQSRNIEVKAFSGFKVNQIWEQIKDNVADYNVKGYAARNIHVPAARLVQEAMTEAMRQDEPFVPNFDNLTRATNLFRKNMRPTEPKENELSFTVVRDFIKGDEFLLDDLRVGEERHIMFATTAQMNHLQTAMRWFIDGTFKVVQLMSVHAFVDEDTQEAAIHDKLFDLWDRYEDGELSTNQLLKNSSYIMGLGPVPATIDDHGEDEDLG